MSFHLHKMKLCAEKAIPVRPVSLTGAVASLTEEA